MKTLCARFKIIGATNRDYSLVISGPLQQSWSKQVTFFIFSFKIGRKLIDRILQQDHLCRFCMKNSKTYEPCICVESSNFQL